MSHAEQNRRYGTVLNTGAVMLACGCMIYVGWVWVGFAVAAAHALAWAWLAASWQKIAIRRGSDVVGSTDQLACNSSTTS